MQRPTLLSLAVVIAVLATGWFDTLASLGVAIGPTLSGDADEQAAGLTPEEKKREERAQDLVDLALKRDDKKTEEEKERTINKDLESLKGTPSAQECSDVQLHLRSGIVC